jgi:hypothetical protein
VPDGASALLLLTVEEMAVNELRETFHHWVRTLAMPITDDTLSEVLPYDGPHQGELGKDASQSVNTARELWDEVEEEVKIFLSKYRSDITEDIENTLELAYEEAKNHEKDAFEQRIREVSSLQKAQSIEKLKREIEAQRVMPIQMDFLDDKVSLAEKRLRDLEDELKLRQNQFGDLLDRLKEEKRRVIEQVIPRRFALRGDAQVFPVTVEIRLPEVQK